MILTVIEISSEELGNVINALDDRGNDFKELIEDLITGKTRIVTASADTWRHLDVVKGK